MPSMAAVLSFVILSNSNFRCLCFFSLAKGFSLIPTWKFNFKDLPIKINSRNVLLTGSAEGYSANMQNNQHDKGEINLTLRDIEGINRLNIESFITEDMQEIGIEDIQFDQSNFSDWDEVGMQLQVEEKLKELLA